MAPKLIQCIKFSFSLTAGARFRWINNKSVPHSSSVRQVKFTAFWLAETVTPLGLRGIYITWGYTFWSSIENFSAYSRVLRGSILLPPRHPSVFARMARWQLLIQTPKIFRPVMLFSLMSLGYLLIPRVYSGLMWTGSSDALSPSSGLYCNGTISFFKILSLIFTI